MNRKHKRLNYEEVRTFPGIENYTEEKTEETIASLEKLSVLFYELYQKSLGK